MSRASVESLRAYLENLKQKYLVPFERELAAIESLAKGAQQSVSYMDYESMISAVTVLAKGHYNIGQNVLIVTLNVPDLWVSGILDEFTPFVYVSDEQFVLELNTNGYVDVGYCRLSALETGKVNLPEYVKFTDYASNSKYGIVKGAVNLGVGVSNDGDLFLVSASEASIIAKTSTAAAITPKFLDYAVKVGVTTNTETLTDEDKTSACDWLGAIKAPTPPNSFNHLLTFNQNGVANTLKFSAGTDFNSIPQRGGEGQLPMPTPINDTDGVPKSYVDNGFVAKITDETTYAQAYVKGADGSNGIINIASSVLPSSLVQRTSTGGVRVAENPTLDDEATSKKFVETYVDGLIAELDARVKALGG